MSDDTEVQAVLYALTAESMEHRFLEKYDQTKDYYLLWWCCSFYNQIVNIIWKRIYFCDLCWY